MSPSRFGRLGRLSCLGGAALGALGLIGWFTGASALTTIVPGQPPMMANTAVGLLAIGVAGALRQPKDAGRVRRAVSLLLAFVVLALSIGTLAEYALATDLGIDQLLFLNQPGPYPGRPSPLTASSWPSCGVVLRQAGRPTSSPP